MTRPKIDGEAVMAFSRRLACLLVGLFCAIAAEAQPTPPSDWYATLMASRQMVASERFADARVAANDVITDVLNGSLVPSQYVREVLVEALVYRAIGESRGMRNDLALWDWYAAVNVDSHFAGVLRNRLQSAQAFPAPESLWVSPPTLHKVGAADRSVTPPKIVERSEAEYPERARRLRVEADVVVETIIGVTGRLSQPRILTKDVEPTLIVATLAAIRGWTFEPARIASEPVPVLYNLTMKFKLKREK